MSGTITSMRGVNKVVTIGRQANFGTPATGSGASVIMRRINSTFSLSKDIVASPEINPTSMVRFSSHGLKRVNGQISGQLSPGAYFNLFENLLRRAPTTGVTAAITVVTATTTLTASGGFFAAGFRLYDVVGLGVTPAGAAGASVYTAGAVGNNGRYLQIVALTDTVMTFRGTGNEVLVAAVSQSVTISVIGRKTFVPVSSPVDVYETVEHYFPDVSPVVSEQYVGLKVVGCRLNMPATGLATAEFQLVGRDLVTGATQYFTAATAANTTQPSMPLYGSIVVGGVDVATITGAQLSISTGVDAQPVMGQNTLPQIALGTIAVSGSLSCYATNSLALATAFQNETDPVSLSFFMKSDSTKNPPFICINIPRAKLNSEAKNDTDRAIMQSINFEGLENLAGGTGTATERTVISYQDNTTS